MPLYPHLEDAAKFDAESLNTRFTLLVDAINVLGGASFQERALNTAHLPSPVLGGPSTTENTGDIVDTPVEPGGFLQVTTGDGAYETFSNDGYRMLGLSNLTLDRSTDATEPTALLVFANVEVREFTNVQVIYASDEAIFGIDLNEYDWDATVALQFSDSAGTSAILTRSERQVSPRVTIGFVGNKQEPSPAEVDPLLAGGLSGRIPMGPLRDLPGGHVMEAGFAKYQQFDHKTFQDVGIRTVVTKEDLTDMGLTNIQSVRLAFKSFNNRTYKVQRANITAIPLLAEVNT